MVFSATYHEQNLKNNEEGSNLKGLMTSTHSEGYATLEVDFLTNQEAVVFA